MSDFTLEELFNYRRHGAGKLVDAYEQQQAIIAKLEYALSESEHGRLALAAHVDLIKRAYGQAEADIRMLFDIQPRQNDHSYLVDGEYCTELNRVIMQSPQTSLAERDAEVARRAYLAGVELVTCVDDDVLERANEYAERVKRGEL